MIQSDHFILNGDSTAWLVDADPNLGLYVWPDLDRPCDTCQGTAWSCIVETDEGDFMEDACPDCDGTGRHAFTVEVACAGCGGTMTVPSSSSVSGYATCNAPHERTTTLRFSVVPGMVLPIFDECADMEPPDHVCQAYRDGRWIRHADFKTSIADVTEEPITLPPAAQPGMWAVLVKVAS